MDRAPPSGGGCAGSTPVRDVKKPHTEERCVVIFYFSSFVYLIIISSSIPPGKLNVPLEPVYVRGVFTFDTAKVKAFLVPAGTAVEVYATSLHYAPCGVAGEGYQVAIVLPKGTNYACQKRDNRKGEDRLIAGTNKWVIGHPEADLDEGTFIGLKGENLSVL